MNNSHYFRHDYNCREDEKIQALIFDFGYEGYGLYWAIIEMLYNNNGEIECNYERIAFILRSEKRIVEKVISHYNLFTVAYNKVSSNRIKKDLTFRKTKSDKARESAYVRWNKEKEKLMRSHSECSKSKVTSQCYKVKESKVKESKVKNINITQQFFEDKNLQDQIIIKLVEKYKLETETVKIKVDDFIRYWTEPNKSGTKQRWQLNKTFEITRRLYNWFNNDFNKYNNNNKSPNTTQL